MNLDKKISTEAFKDFVIFLDSNIKNPNKIKITRKKEQVIVQVPYQTNQEFIDDIRKVFIFKNNYCLYEYGGIRLDFSPCWQNYIENHYTNEL